MHWVYKGRKMHAGTGQKSNRLWSKVAKIRANRIKHKILNICEVKAQRRVAHPGARGRKSPIMAENCMFARSITSTGLDPTWPRFGL